MTDSQASRAAPNLEPIAWCAVAFFLVALASLGVVVALVANAGFNGRSGDFAGLQNLFFAALICAAIGYGLIRASRNAVQTQDAALPPDARDILSSAIQSSADPVSDWTRLVGLTGGTGTFRKLELSGMPLATILMTVLFCLLGLLAETLPSLFAPPTGAKAPLELADAGKIFLDMAKLTLGAFIGSFVTNGTSKQAQAAKDVAAATAKALKAPPAPSPPPSPGG